MIKILRRKLYDTHITVQLFFLLILLNYLDFHTTKLLVDIHGFEVEANPILRYIMDITGSVYSILLVKTIAIAFLGFWFNKEETQFKNKIKWVLILINMVFGTVCGMNIYYVSLVYGFIS